MRKRAPTNRSTIHVPSSSQLASSPGGVPSAPLTAATSSSAGSSSSSLTTSSLSTWSSSNSFTTSQALKNNDSLLPAKTCATGSHNSSQTTTPPSFRHSSSTAHVGTQSRQPTMAQTPLPVSTSTSLSHEEITPFPDMPSLLDVPVAERGDLVVQKIKLCCTVMDFSKPDVDVQAKNKKRQTLVELAEYFTNSRHCFTDANLEEVPKMVSANIFRPLQSSSRQCTPAYDPDDDDPSLDAAWSHLSSVYDLFLKCIVSAEVPAKALKKFVNQTFIAQLLQLFSSQDPRERECLKTILHRIYGKVTAMRSFIRKAIEHCFFKFTYDNEGHCGIAELLEILGSIINGFALPLKEEHQVFLTRSLIPLHKSKALNAFHHQIVYCLTQYVEKDSRVAEPIIRGLLKYWPATNTPKEVLFINELEGILELTQSPEYQKVMEPLFTRLARCIESRHYQVAERVLFLWNNDYIVKAINHHRKVIYPIILPALYRNSKNHWNSGVHGLTYNVSKLMAEADPVLFDACSDKYIGDESRALRQEEQTRMRWEELEKAFKDKATE
eukprot:GHVQ01038040.1.p1 GENE.GHVQ01038040.1~~GHVQ01038040.1.p1  ORF type:complete len:553 (-),score=67.76 GHVQ01038040.1:328-1986(-)